MRATRPKTRIVRPKASQVWTPRSHEVNDAMYIARPSAEKELQVHLEGSLHVLLCGESGIGKSWLYKTVCHSKGIRYLIADSANASRAQSIDAEIALALKKLKPTRQTGFKETKRASGKLPFAEGGLEIERSYEFSEGDVFAELLFEMRKQGIELLVFENFERLTANRALIQQLGDILTLVDNPDYGKYGVRILLVGAVREAASYFRATDTQETIANRIKEIPLFGGLSKSATLQLCHRGFEQSLMAGFSPVELEALARRVHHLTLGIPQRVHELCYEIAALLEEVDYVCAPAEFQNILITAELRWVRGHLIQLYTNLSGRLNHDNPNARRNQVLFVLGQMQTDVFRVNDVERHLRKEFPELHGKALNVGQILKQLSEEPHAILRRQGSRAIYEFCHGAMRMVIRSIISSRDEVLSIRSVTAGSY